MPIYPLASSLFCSEPLSLRDFIRKDVYYDPKPVRFSSRQ